MPNDNTDTNLFPPIPPKELEGAHSYDNIERVVVTRDGVYGKSKGGGWVKFHQPN